jgi:hypothetical protein
MREPAPAKALQSFALSRHDAVVRRMVAQILPPGFSSKIFKVIHLPCPPLTVCAYTLYNPFLWGII